MTRISRCCETYIQSTKVNVGVCRRRNVSSASVTLKRSRLAPDWPHLSFKELEDTYGALINRHTVQRVSMSGAFCRLVDGSCKSSPHSVTGPIYFWSAFVQFSTTVIGGPAGPRG